VKGGASLRDRALSPSATEPLRVSSHPGDAPLRDGWWDHGVFHPYGGKSPNGAHYARDYESAACFPGHRKADLSELSGPARAAVAYPARRSIRGQRLSAREFAFIKTLSCKSRVVFWLYYKLKWTAREIADMFGWGFLDPHVVYIRNGVIKRALFKIETADKNIDWGAVRELRNEGATEQELVEFYGIGLATLRKHLRDA
jgi:hypothetical protein